MQSIVFDGQHHERLEIVVKGYERAPTGDYHDDNWLPVTVSLAVGAFRGSFDASFLAGELEELHENLSQLYEALSGSTVFNTLEEQLRLEFVGNGRGSIDIFGEAMDQPGIGNKVSFTIKLDQSQLGQSVQSLKAAVAAFPVRT